MIFLARSLFLSAALAWVFATPALGAPSSHRGDNGVTRLSNSQKKPKGKKRQVKQGESKKKSEPKETSLRVSARDQYSVYSTGLFQEVYIDDNLNLYKVRQYGGIVPSLEEKRGMNLASGAIEPGERLVIHRIGFEQRELFSRLFVLGSRAMSPWIYDNFAQAQGNPEINHQIIIEIPGARIPKHNDRRPLVTSAFNTPVATVESKHMKDGGGIRIVVTLKKEARYLPVQAGRLLFLDVER